MELRRSPLHSDTEKNDNYDPVFSINDIQDRYTKETNPRIHAKSSTYGRECNEQQLKDTKHSLNIGQNEINVSLECFSVDDSLELYPSSAKSELVYTSSADSSNLDHSVSEFMASEGTSVDESHKFLQNSDDGSQKYFAVPFPEESSKSNFSVQHRFNYWCKICGKGFASKAKLRPHVTFHFKKIENDESHFPCCYTYGRKCNEQELKDTKHSLNRIQKGIDDSLKLKSSTKSVAPQLVYTLSESSANLGHSVSKSVASEDTSVDESYKFLQNSNDKSKEYFAVPFPGESSKSNFSVQRSYNHRCKICEKGFETQAKLRAHVTIHSKKSENYASHFPNRYIKVLSCTECGKVFKSHNVLTKHFEYNHSEGELHLCKNCGNAFKSFELLSSHLADHCSEKRRYLCDVCGKAFKLWPKLKLHLAFHSEERPFVCDACGKGFKIRTHLTTHLLRHSKEFPYVCNVCNRGFKVKCNLTRHLPLHKEERPYVCNLCGKGFKFKAALQKHQNLLVRLKGCERAVNVEKLSGKCTS